MYVETAALLPPSASVRSLGRGEIKCVMPVPLDVDAVGKGVSFGLSSLVNVKYFAAECLAVEYIAADLDFPSRTNFCRSCP